MRRVVVTLAISLIVMSLSIPSFAHAQAPATDADIHAREGTEFDSFKIEGGKKAAPGERANPKATPVSGDRAPAPPPPSDIIYEPSWGTHPETREPCIALTQFVRDNAESSQLAVDFEHRLLMMMDDRRIVDVEHTFCSDVEGLQSTLSPAAVAQAFIRTFGIPDPEPRIDPGWALTGLPSYLEIEGQEGFVHEEDIPAFGTLRVEFAPSAFVVNWGDGTETYVDDGRTGAPHDGPEAQQISHVYTDTSAGNVVDVEARWHARWWLAGFSGSVGSLQTSAQFPLDVREMQAVRTSR